MQLARQRLAFARACRRVGARVHVAQQARVAPTSPRATRRMAEYDVFRHPPAQGLQPLGILSGDQGIYSSVVARAVYQAPPVMRTLPLGSDVATT